MNKLSTLLVVIGIILCLVIGAVYIKNREDELPPIPIVPNTFGGAVDSNGTYYLTTGWNMVSVPDTSTKDDIYITYNTNSYNWTQAYTQGIIADIIMTYDGADYVESDMMYKCSGYWMYSFSEPVYLDVEPYTLYCFKTEYNATLGTNVSCNTIKYSNLYSNTIYYTTLQFQNYEAFYTEDEPIYIEGPLE